jgi:hypothetical protein
MRLSSGEFDWALARVVSRQQVRSGKGDGMTIASYESF